MSELDRVDREFVVEVNSSETSQSKRRWRGRRELGGSGSWSGGALMFLEGMMRGATRTRSRRPFAARKEWEGC